MNLLYKSSLFLVVTLYLIALNACSNTNTDNTYVGYVEAQWSYIAAPQSGWLVAIPVEEGSKVEAGQILFELDKQQQQAQLAEATGRAAQANAQAQDIESGARPSELRGLDAQLKQAQANLFRAESERRRILPLVEKGIESAGRGELVEANYKVAQASVIAATEAINTAKLSGRDQAKAAAAAGYTTMQASQIVAQWQLDERTVRALIEGRVEEVFYNPGEFVSAGSPVLALLPGDGLRVRFFVPQSKLSELSKGQVLQIRSDGSESSIDAKISHIATAAEFTPPVIYSTESRGKLVFMVEAKLPAGTNLNPGLPVDIIVQ